MTTMMAMIKVLHNAWVIKNDYRKGSWSESELKSMFRPAPAAC